MASRKTKTLQKLEARRSHSSAEFLRKLPDHLSVAGAVRRDSVDEKSRRVSVAFSSESPTRDFDYLDPIVLLHEAQAVDLEPLRGLGSVLYDHDTRAVIGRPENVTIDYGERVGRAEIVFDSDPDADLVWQKVKSGSVRGVSVRYKALEGFVIRKDESWTSPGGKTFQGPLAVITRWAPREISLTPLPADATVGVGRSARDAQEDDMPEWLKALLVKRGLVKEDADEGACRKALEALPEDLSKILEGQRKSDSKEPVREDPAKQPVSAAKASAAPVADDVLRSARMEGQQTSLAMIQLAKTAGSPERAAEWLEKGYTLEQARNVLLDDMIATRRPLDTRVTVEEDADDKFFRAHLAVVGRRINGAGGSIQLKEVEKDGLDLAADLPMHEIVRSFAVRGGLREARGWDRNRLATAGLAFLCGSRAMQHSASDFPYLLENLATKSLASGFQLAPTTYQAWTTPISVADFKTQSRVKLSEAEEFAVNPELIPISESTAADTRETYSVSTYARRFGVSRQAIINDDLAGFSRIPAMFGAAAARTMNKKVYTTVNTGKTMAEDSVALFATTHTSGSNLGTAAAPSDTTLAEARKLMRKQKGLNPNSPAILNLTPRFLIIPAYHENTCLKLMQTYYPATVANATVDWVRQLQLIVEPELDALAENAWYLVADPSQIDTVGVVFLNGVRTPQITRLDGTAILGVEWVSYFDFGVALTEHRGLFKNAGA